MNADQIPLLPDAVRRSRPARGARRREAARDLPVARVALLTPVPHLDRIFDYEVPEELSATALAGVRVRVRLSGRLVDGYILARVQDSDRDLQPLSSVHGPPVLTQEIAELCRRVADRYAGTLADVLRFAVPPRRARAESRSASSPEPADVPQDAVDPVGWSAYRGGAALLAGIGGAVASRALWIASPGERPAQRIAELALAVRARGRGVLVVAPDATDVDRIATALSEAGIPAARLVAESGPETRYRAFLSILFGRLGGGFITAYLGWRWTYVMSAAMMLALAPALIARLPSAPPRSGSMANMPICVLSSPRPSFKNVGIQSTYS